MMIELLLILLALVCGWQAIHARALLIAALWLAGVSAFVALVMYGMGAAETAVIELSVGAGLITILFVFAIAIAGDEAMTASSVVPKLLGWLLLAGIISALGWFIWPVGQIELLVDELPFTAVLWEARGLDVLVQIGLIFAGVMGILGLLSEESVPQSTTIETQPVSPALWLACPSSPTLSRSHAKEKLT